ncbi:MAG TPA: DDE-type integrase/transposase/recombinase [Pseudonocardia sp.]|uniref:DDE-type integrase/transposase/recombinase n=1 Tax=Pseudonocardia sp. TaxID=60912 RepID=UPI002BD61ADC|nr:DDE-type integrase/transposase/recombinase [Pseudonocardia sp.]HTF54145.1 DDE-type integrase/transposase/recombinase [Pseudonocardia sp.]
MRLDEAAARAERARAIGLFRYQLIREAADPELTTRARGRMVRELAARSHLDPAGRSVRVSRESLDRWIRAWRSGGFDALVPSPRQSSRRLPAEVIDMAVALKRENPDRTATQVRRILRAQMGWAPGERTLQRHFAELTSTDPTLLGAGQPGVFGRFEAGRPNELWTGDALHGPRIGGRKTYLFAFLDDHSRAIVGHRFGFAEDTVRLAAALRPALGSRGVPEGVYVDNGSAFVDTWLLRACAKLGIRLIHSTPGRPQGRGKIERFFRTVREQFLVEITGIEADSAGGGTDGGAGGGRHQVGDLDELNRLFTAWVEQVYHRRVHSETDTAPLARWSAGGPFPLPTPAALAEAFLWEEHRTVTKTALVSLQGNTYQVEPTLVGRRVELIFDPFDLTRIEVRLRGAPAGIAVPHRIARHSHVKARPETAPAPPTPTGINYAHLIDTAHHAELARGVNYAALAGELPGQLDLLTGNPVTRNPVAPNPVAPNPVAPNPVAPNTEVTP